MRVFKLVKINSKMFKELAQSSRVSGDLFFYFFFIPFHIVFIILFYNGIRSIYYNTKIKSSFHFKNKIECLLWPNTEEDGKVPSSNESETQALLKPHAPAPPLQTLTFWSES